MTVVASGLSGGDIAAIVAALFWAVLVGFLALPLVKLSRMIGEASKLVAGVTTETLPILNEVHTSVSHVNTELERVDAITANVQEMSHNISAMTGVFAATLGSPAIKVAAFSYGVRRALTDRREQDVRKRVKREMKAERSAGRRGTKASG